MNSLFKKRKKVNTVLEISENYIKMAQRVILGKEKVINKIRVEKIKGLNIKEIISFIRDWTKEGKINSKELVISIPSGRVITKNLTLPSIDLAEINGMMDLQVGKLTPFTKNEIIFDYKVIETNVEGYSHVVVAIVQKDIIERYFMIIEGAGLQLEKINLSSVGMIEWYNLTVGQDKKEEPYVLIDIDYDKSDFAIILGDIPIFSRTVSLGGGKGSEDIIQWQDKFVSKLKNIINSYHNEIVDKELSGIVIGGAENFIARLDKNYLAKTSGLDVDILMPVKEIFITDECLGEYRNDLDKNKGSIPSILGLAMSFGAEQFNFISQEKKEEKAVKDRGKDLYFLGIYLVFMVLTISSIILGRMYIGDRYIQRLEREISSIQNKADEVSSMLRKIKIIKQRKRIKNYSLDIIYQVYQAIPPEIFLVSVSLVGEDSLAIRGTANMMAEVFKFVGKLEGSGYFENVKTKYATKHKIGNKELTDFEISCPLTQKNDIY